MELSGKRILIIKPSSLGDVVHTLPLVHALKRWYPGTRLGWIVQDVYAELLERDTAIDQVYPIHISSTSDPHAGRLAYLHAFRETVKTFRLLRGQLREAPYDLVLDLHASFRSGLLGRTNPGGMRVGFKGARELNTFFQDQLLEVPGGIEHAVEKNLLFCDYLGCSVAAEDFFMCSGRKDEAVVQSFLDRQGLAEGTVIVYANPAARWQTKFWPAAKWAELADRLVGRGAQILFGGSGQDKVYIQSITRLMKTRSLVSAGDLTLVQSVALMQRCALYVGLDSGPMHMAALAGVPVVALFGPTHPARVGPYGVEHRIVRAVELDCLECRKRFCPQLRCMQDISVDRVYGAALELLAGTIIQPGSIE